MTMTELEKMCEEFNKAVTPVEVKKYKMRTISYSSCPEKYGLTKGWLNDNKIVFEEHMGYSNYITYELTLSQVAELVAFLNKYSARERYWEIEV